MIEKLKLWFKETGLTNVGYLGAFIASLLIGSKFLAGAALGIFVYINFNIIQKLVRDKIEKIRK